jgi:dTMP kinase
MKNGFFITFEGVEGSGKSLQAKRLCEFLGGRGYEVVLTREPGGLGLPIAESIRATLLDVKNQGMHSLTELFLYLASRAQHVRELIKPALDSGKIVISDRFGDASIAYQGGGRGLTVEWIQELNLVATDRLKPDLTILLDISPDKGLERVAADAKRQKGECPGKDRIEREELEFHQRVRETYLKLAEKERNRFFVLAGDRSPLEIEQKITAKVMNLLRSIRSPQ